MTCVFHFCWFKDNQHIAIWLEGAALVGIFGLDFFQRRTDEKEQEKRHAETLLQLEVSRQQVPAAIDAANAAKRGADITAAPNRPLMGLLHFTFIGDLNSRPWQFERCAPSMYR